MPQGLMVWGPGGNLKLDITDRLTRIHAIFYWDHSNYTSFPTLSVAGILYTYADYYVPGVQPDGGSFCATNVQWYNRAYPVSADYIRVINAYYSPSQYRTGNCVVIKA